MLIPRIFHQIWVGPKPLPDESARYRRTWLEHHPDWEVRLWTEENLPPGLRRPEVHDRLRSPVERSDILRLELLWRFGGVYVDCDFECLRPIEPLIGQVDFFAADTEPGRVNNALIGSVAGHPIVDRALDELRPREFIGYDKEATGPLFLDRLLKDYPDVKVFEKRLFYAKGEEALEHGYAIHHEANTWKDSEALRVDARKAARKAQKATDEARRWRLRYEEAEAELAAIRRVSARTDADRRSLPRDEAREAGRLRRATGRAGISMLRRAVTPLQAIFSDRTPEAGRTAALAAWCALALAVATLGSYDAASRIIADHNNFGDGEYVVMGIAWLVLAAWAGRLGPEILGTHRTRNRRLVVTLLFAALPYSAIFESDLGYVLNIVLGLIAVAFALAVRPDRRALPTEQSPPR